MLVYSLARLRLPTTKLFKKIADLLERNYVNIEVKDIAILFWSFSRINYPKNNKINDILRSRSIGLLKMFIDDTDNLYYIEDESPLLTELLDNIIV